MNLEAASTTHGCAVAVNPHALGPSTVRCTFQKGSINTFELSHLIEKIKVAPSIHRIHRDYYYCWFINPVC
jgi:hypothetical protein